MLQSIKEISEIAFALIGSIVAILTYRAAKETILQPVRTEVIKKQTDLLIETLTLVDEEVSLTNSIDYHGIIEANIIESMLKCGSVFSDQEGIKKFRNDKVGGGILLSKEEVVDELEVVTMFDDSKLNKENVGNQDKYFTQAKSGNFELKILDLTKNYMSFINKLSKAKESPFLPINIKILLEKLSSDILFNVTKPLKNSVEIAVNESFKRGTKTIPKVSGVYNEFNHKRLSHEGSVVSLRLEIRKYLKIDSMP